ncbi:lisH domain and HEAT repeat-containing protein KIAA1468 homolog [Sesamum indicum]|uniref:LisH domain and HEAT repeat-containing protein KIAA1468 homolog n=1 Tax=Sesamum indicum TaxID=4182 RepID=A0A6I9UBP2_SESIN|nr:lisH domain and HEAT repeat-containing protein KIAA1468 homolog [Sesamum indicum]
MRGDRIDIHISEMDVEKSSLCNFVVNFLLEENYLLSAFELLHELLEDGRGDQAIRLQEFFSDPTQFPPDQISRFSSLRAAEPQNILDEKDSVEKKLAVSEYELRVAQEDILKLKDELLKKIDSKDKSNGPDLDVPAKNEPVNQPMKRSISCSDLGPLKDNERFDINCAVKEYLLLAGYRLTAMTFYEEVDDQNWDVWQNSAACVPNALRQYYYQYLSSTAEGAEEKIAMLREIGRLKHEKQSLLKTKEMSDAQIIKMKKSIDALKKDVKEKENLVKGLKKTSESQRKELNDCRAEITSLKMHIEGALSGKILLLTDSAQMRTSSPGKHNEETELFQKEIEMSKVKNSPNAEPTETIKVEEGNEGQVHDAEEPKVNETGSPGASPLADLVKEETQMTEKKASEDTISLSEKVLESPTSFGEFGFAWRSGFDILKNSGRSSPRTDSAIMKSDHLAPELCPEKLGLGTIHILSNALPKIVPYVLINHREELLPLIMCAIERHPDSATRDSLTHTLFNLIKRPDEQQRRIIMDACVTLAKNVGELRTETELLPQCWEQVNHMYEERRMLVAQSCGELAELVRPEIRDSLILSIVQQLIEDSATVVREAAAHNLALLLPLFPNTEKYFKVEELMFQLVGDPSGTVVETTIKELVPALINWGNNLDHVLQVTLSHLLGSAQRCPPLSGVEGSIELHLRVLGERDRWNVDVMLHLLAELLPCVHHNVVETCPFPEVSHSTGILFAPALLELFARGEEEWPAFEWLHSECFPSLIRLASLLSPKEDDLRNHITRFLLAVGRQFGESYLTHIMLPVFLVAVGDDADLKYFPFQTQLNIIGSRPQTETFRRIATMCVLPLLLAGVLGHPSKHEYLTEYLRNRLIQSSEQDDLLEKLDIIHAVRFLCTFEEHHSMIFNILWDMVVSSDEHLKITAANLWKLIVPYIDAKVASIHVVPALVTLGSEPNLNVKYASIDAFGAVAQHFKNDMIVDKIRIQMDAFLEEGSYEASIAVVRALGMSVPYTTDTLRNYLLSKIFELTASSLPSSDVLQRRERANAFCESIRALDATDLPASSVKDFLVPAIQNLLKDSDALDPAHKEALEIILKERSSAVVDPISKVMGGPMGLASSVSSFFGDGLLGRKEGGDGGAPPPETIEPHKPISQPPVEDTRLRRIFTDILRSKVKNHDETNAT